MAAARERALAMVHATRGKGAAGTRSSDQVKEEAQTGAGRWRGPQFISIGRHRPAPASAQLARAIPIGYIIRRVKPKGCGDMVQVAVPTINII